MSIFSCCCGRKRSKIGDSDHYTKTEHQGKGTGPSSIPSCAAHLLDRNICGCCSKSIGERAYYIHQPAFCLYHHSDVADQVKSNRDLSLAKGILSATVGGGVLAVRAGRLAIVGEIGNVTGKCIGGALAGLGVITSVIDIVDAATEEAPELPKCKRCGRAEAEQPGCILVCRACGVECNDWRDASPKHHCFKVCEDCYSCRVCMKCNKAPASRKEHQNSSKMRIHRRLSTHLYGTQKAGRITGSSLTIAGTVGCAVPVVGWAVGPALITGRMRK